MYKLCSANEALDATKDILTKIYEENPAHWPNGLTPDHFDGGLYLVRQASTEEPVGFAGWQERWDQGSSHLEKVGYYSIGILEQHRRKGFAKEAVQKLIEQKAAAVDNVKALVVETNVPSLQLAGALQVPVIVKQAGAPVWYGSKTPSYIPYDKTPDMLDGVAPAGIYHGIDIAPDPDPAAGIVTKLLQHLGGKRSLPSSKVERARRLLSLAGVDSRVSPEGNRLEFGYAVGAGHPGSRLRPDGSREADYLPRALKGHIEESLFGDLEEEQAMNLLRNPVKSAADSATTRTRRYNRRHPDKVRAYLRSTQSARVERNRAHRSATNRLGEAKMKNKDVHHPKGTTCKETRVVKEDHGPDKKKQAAFGGLAKLLGRASKAAPEAAAVAEAAPASGLAKYLKDFADKPDLARVGIGAGIGALAGTGESDVFGYDPRAKKINIFLSTLLGAGAGLAGRRPGALLKAPGGAATELVAGNVPKMLGIALLDSSDKFMDSQQGLVDTKLDTALKELESAETRQRTSGRQMGIYGGLGALGVTAMIMHALKKPNNIGEIKLKGDLNSVPKDRWRIDIPKDKMSDKVFDSISRDMLFEAPKQRRKQAQYQLVRQQMAKQAGLGDWSDNLGRNLYGKWKGVTDAADRVRGNEGGVGAGLMQEYMNLPDAIYKGLESENTSGFFDWGGHVRNFGRGLGRMVMDPFKDAGRYAAYAQTGLDADGQKMTGGQRFGSGLKSTANLGLGLLNVMSAPATAGLAARAAMLGLRTSGRVGGRALGYAAFGKDGLKALRAESAARAASGAKGLQAAGQAVAANPLGPGTSSVLPTFGTAKNWLGTKAYQGARAADTGLANAHAGLIQGHQRLMQGTSNAVGTMVRPLGKRTSEFAKSFGRAAGDVNRQPIHGLLRNKATSSTTAGTGKALGFKDYQDVTKRTLSPFATPNQFGSTAGGLKGKVQSLTYPALTSTVSPLAGHGDESQGLTGHMGGDTVFGGPFKNRFGISSQSQSDRANDLRESISRGTDQGSPWTPKGFWNHATNQYPQQGPFNMDNIAGGLNNVLGLMGQQNPYSANGFGSYANNRGWY